MVSKVMNQAIDRELISDSIYLGLGSHSVALGFAPTIEGWDDS
jgi:ABC-type transport system substrate-binding protein